MSYSIFRAVVFDFDGTLTELTLDFGLLREEVFKIARGYTDPETLKCLDGFYIIEMIYELERRLGERGRVFSGEAFKRLEELEIEAAAGKDVFPYTREVLKGLKDRGIKNGIITRSCVAVLHQVFPDINDYVHGISTREHIRYVKPDPRHVEHVLESIQVRPKDAMLVGDHPTDITAGKDAGLKTVGVLSGRTKQQSFKEAGADYIINDIREILAIVDGRLNQ
ncbi:MAG TPA: HAD family hydrolase [Syntrophorhabdaceae bacterium]|nr:HAD family hydrolase [Syntrophorhabdaceae bacterium]HOT42890.1 HAD family hydrolase [Syntrophorhabdaceae bacterium]HQE80968.1 HAD family hydrolase [Syntrophorhabdaceae bacterium]HQH44115.1 HAD family hydrolase [Syntrophorhabdaceae bacterium]HQK47242.1 HAD family hydrolase [Syntrophorhabdaceae bacterium]